VRASIHHVQVSIPPQGEDRARRFYVDLLGLREVEKPPNLAARGGIWLALDVGQLHLGVEPEFRPAAKAHPALEVAGWTSLRERLARAGVPVLDDAELPGRRRFYVRDPFGNRLEFVEAAERGP
jgi:catechol 2,3-dioxygenase-like lactoylglutathione lyase family enzyme